MKSYSSVFTDAAKRDIQDACNYIEFSLYNPTASENLLEELEDELDSLEDNPFICSVIDDPFLKPFGLRFSIIKNYLLFYTVSPTDKTITILRFLYGKMNWKSILRQSFTID